MSVTLVDDAFQPDSPLGWVSLVPGYTLRGKACLVHDARPFAQIALPL